MKIIKKSYRINAPVELVWKALTDSASIESWGGGPGVVMNDQVGTRFKLWDGDIYGENKEVVNNKLLRQDWYSESDNFEEASEVVFMLRAEKGYTILELTHSKVPDKAARNISNGWDEYYVGPLKQLAETLDE